MNKSVVFPLFRPFFSAEFPRFLVVGGASTALNYAIFFLLLRFFGVFYPLASALGYGAALLVGYCANRTWTFDHKKKHSSRLFASYLLVYGFSLSISLGFLVVLVDILGVSPEWGNLVALGISTILNFLGLRLFVFSEQDS